MSELIHIGLIGTGFMGKAHTLGYAIASHSYGEPVTAKLDLVAGIDAQTAKSARQSFHFERSTANWLEVINDSKIDVVCITTPNALHKQMSLAAIAAGKHVHCEKPLAPSLPDALEMTLAAEAKQVKTQVGFNYITNPLFALAKEMISAGELGEIYSYRGVHAEDYMADPRSPYTFRHHPVGGGVTADLGSHTIATAEYLLGKITRVSGDCRTLIPQRMDDKGQLHDILVDDISRANIEFESGVCGSIEANWCATGRTSQHDFEVYGSKGALVFSQERLNELHYYKSGEKVGRGGFRKIETGAEHNPYGNFCVAKGHQLGFNELKAIEAAGFMKAVLGMQPEPFNFRAGLGIQLVVEAILQSSKEKTWVDIID